MARMRRRTAAILLPLIRWFRRNTPSNSSKTRTKASQTASTSSQIRPSRKKLLWSMTGLPRSSLNKSISSSSSLSGTSRRPISRIRTWLIKHCRIIIPSLSHRRRRAFCRTRICHTVVWANKPKTRRRWKIRTHKLAVSRPRLALRVSEWEPPMKRLRVASTSLRLQFLGWVSQTMAHLIRARVNHLCRRWRRTSLSRRMPVSSKTRHRWGSPQELQVVHSTRSAWWAARCYSEQVRPYWMHQTTPQIIK